MLLPVRASEPAAQTRSHDQSLFLIKFALHTHACNPVDAAGELDCGGQDKQLELPNSVMC